MEPTDLYTGFSEPVLALPGVARGTMMGYPCLRVDGAFFASCDPHTGELIVKLPADHVLHMIESGTGKPFAPAGRRFREWIVIEHRDAERWTDLIQQALEFVRTLPRPG